MLDDETLQHRAFTRGALDPTRHERLWMNLSSIADDAGLPPEMLWQPFRERVGNREIDYVSQFGELAKRGVAGLCYTGTDVESASHETMQLIAAVLTRNFIRARVIWLSQVLDALQAGESIEARCLLIPNLHVERGHKLPGWKVSKLYELLHERAANHEQTVVYVHSMRGLAEDYGKKLAQLIEYNYLFHHID